MALFGLEVSDFIAVLALCVAVASIWFTYSRNRKSEQIKIAREIRNEINDKITSHDKFRLENKYPSEGSAGARGEWIIDLVR